MVQSENRMLCTLSPNTCWYYACLPYQCLCMDSRWPMEMALSLEGSTSWARALYGMTRDRLTRRWTCMVPAIFRSYSCRRLPQVQHVPASRSVPPWRVRSSCRSLCQHSRCLVWLDGPSEEDCSTSCISKTKEHACASTSLLAWLQC